MSEKIQLRRSAVAGRVPTTSQLDLGEIGINTNDGKLFIKKDDGSTTSIVEIGDIADLETDIDNQPATVSTGYLFNTSTAGNVASSSTVHLNSSNWSTATVIYASIVNSKGKRVDAAAMEYLKFGAKIILQDMSGTGANYLKAVCTGASSNSTTITIGLSSVEVNGSTPSSLANVNLGVLTTANGYSIEAALGFDVEDNTGVGAFTTDELTDNVTLKSALETLGEKAKLLREGLGVSVGDTDLGTFAGDIITDNQTVKGALRNLEQAIERGAVSVNATRYKFSTATGSGPGTGKLRYDDATLSSVATIYLHEEDRDGRDMKVFFDDMLKQGATIYVASGDNSADLLKADLTSDATYDTNYYTLNLTNIEVSGAIPTADDGLTFGLVGFSSDYDDLTNKPTLNEIDGEHELVNEAVSITGSNVILNGDWATEDSTNWTYGDSVFNEYYNMGAHAYIAVRTGGSTANGRYQAFTTTVGATYDLSISTVGEGGAKIYNGTGSGGTQLVSVLSTDTGTDYVTLTTTFTATSTTSTISLQLPVIGGSYGFNDVVVTEQQSLPTLKIKSVTEGDTYASFSTTGVDVSGDFTVNGSALATVATSGNYDDLTNKPALDTAGISTTISTATSTTNAGTTSTISGSDCPLTATDYTDGSLFFGAEGPSTTATTNFLTALNSAADNASSGSPFELTVDDGSAYVYQITGRDGTEFFYSSVSPAAYFDGDSIDSLSTGSPATYDVTITGSNNPIFDSSKAVTIDGVEYASGVWTVTNSSATAEDLSSDPGLAAGDTIVQAPSLSYSVNGHTDVKLANFSDFGNILNTSLFSFSASGEITATDLRAEDDITLGAVGANGDHYIYARLGNGSALSFRGVDANGNVENMIQCYNDTASGVKLYTNNVLKLQTTTSGCTVTGTVNETSDARLKKDVAIIDSALDKVSELNGVTFKWISDDIASAGVIAQDVEKVLPMLVETSADDEMKSVSYSGLIGLLIESVKELKAEIDDLKSRQS